MAYNIDGNSPEPPFRQLAALIRGAIHRGEFVEHDSLPSVREIVRESGLSLATVQRAFAQLQQEHTVYSLSGKGNFVSPLKEGLPRRIHIFLPHSALSFYSLILLGITEVAREKEFDTVLHSLDTDKLLWNLNTVDQLAKVREARESVIFIGEAFGEIKKACLDTAEQVPFVTLEWKLEDASAVVNDYEDSARSILERLDEELAPKSVLILKGRDYQYNVIERLKGFQSYIRQADWHLEDRVFFRDTDFDAISGYETTKAFLAERRPDCILCANDYEAIGTIGAVTEQGLLPGKDVHVIGYGDMIDPVTSYFPITTISQNLPDMGRQAVLAVTALHEGESPRTTVVATEYHRRTT